MILADGMLDHTERGGKGGGKMTAVPLTRGGTFLGFGRPGWVRVRLLSSLGTNTPRGGGRMRLGGKLALYIALRILAVMGARQANPLFATSGSLPLVSFLSGSSPIRGACIWLGLVFFPRQLFRPRAGTRAKVWIRSKLLTEKSLRPFRIWHSFFPCWGGVRVEKGTFAMC